MPRKRRSGSGGTFRVTLPTAESPQLRVDLEGGDYTPDERARAETDMGYRMLRLLQTLAKEQGAEIRCTGVRVEVAGAKEATTGGK